MLLFALCLPFLAFSQKTIKGVITDGEGETLVGASIIEEGTTNGTITDLDGKYSLDVSAEGTEIVISYVGYMDQKVNIQDSTKANIVLLPDVYGLDELVVIGYSTQKRKNRTGAVSSIQPGNIEDLPLPSLETALQGAAAGVNVNKNSGKPGGGIDVNVRGRTSILASNQPLYIIDGVPIISGDNFDFAREAIGGSNVSVMSDINPDDIESIEILKDAASAAIYGSRAANGVVLITTKKGKSGDTKVGFNASIGNSWLPKKLDLITGDQYQEYISELYCPVLELYGLPCTYDAVTENLLGPLGTANTDWQDEVFRRAPTQEYSVNFSGGTDKTKFYSSLGFSDQQGIIKSSGFKRFSGRLNLEHFMSDRLGFGMTMGYSNTNTQQVQNDNNIYGVMGAAILIPPVVPVYNEDGSWGGAFGIENATAAVTDYSNNIKRDRLNGTAYVKWNIFESLSFKTSIGTDFLNSSENIYEPRTLQSSSTGRAVVADVVNARFLNDYVLNFNQSFGRNSLDALVGTSYQRDNIDYNLTEVVDFPTDDFRGLSSGATPVTTTGAYTGDILQSFFGSVRYSLGSRYFLEGTFRADGSSRFINNKWGYFPGVSVGWNLAEEAFLAQSPFDQLKLRAGWGQAGNNVIDNFDARQLYGGGANYDDDTPGTEPTQIGNPDLSWETTTQLNIGLDFGLFNNRLSGSVDGYVKTTEDLLLDRPIPTTSGFTTVTENVGVVQNRGIDLTLNTVNIQKKDFTWNTTFTLGYLQNEILELYNGTPIDAGFATRIAEGQPLGSFFGHKVEGIFQNQAEIDAAPTQSSAAPGDLRFADISGGAGEDNILGTADDLAPDGVINDDDRTFIGKALPDFTGGLRNNVTFHGIDLGIFFQFATGFDVYNNNLAFAEGMNSVFSPTVRAWENRWQQEGDDTDIPRLVRGDPNGNRRDSERFVEKGDYLRLKTLTLGYTLPKSATERIGIRKARVFMSGYNLWTLTGYSWYDPEVNMFDGSNTALGTDFLSFPQARSLVFGLSLGF